MTTPTILQDGRRVQADGCCDMETALGAVGPTEGQPELSWRTLYSYIGLADKVEWYLLCQCCVGSGEHAWSPSGHGVDPDGGHYSCGPCAATGEFKVAIP